TVRTISIATRQGVGAPALGGRVAIRPEAGVERAIAGEPCQGEVVYPVDEGLPLHDDLPVLLQGNGRRLKRHVIGAREIGGHFATRAEAGVERAVAVVARESEVEASVDVSTGRSRRHDPAVRLDGDGICLAIGTREIRRHLATRTEAGIERVVTVVACKGDVKASADLVDPRR